MERLAQAVRVVKAMEKKDTSCRGSAQDFRLDDDVYLLTERNSLGQFTKVDSLDGGLSIRRGSEGRIVGLSSDGGTAVQVEFFEQGTGLFDSRELAKTEGVELDQENLARVIEPLQQLQRDLNYEDLEVSIIAIMGKFRHGDDPFGLRSRFCLEQRLCFDEAMEEIRSGRKRGHWSWFLFPTAPYVVEGEERGSMMNREYCLRDPPPNDLRGDDAARAFLRFSAEGVDLRANYVAMMTAVAEQLESGRTAEELVGFMDEPKLRSSLELFERVARGGFDEEVCALCLRALAALGPPAQRPW